MKFSFLLILSALTVILSCSESSKKEQQQAKMPAPTESVVAENFKKNSTSEIANEILCILQDKKGVYWFGSQNAGVYRYDGSHLVRFTTEDGLFQNQIQTIQEDDSGNIWFGTGGFGVSRFNGKKITTPILKANSGTEKDWNLTTGELWFYAGGGIFHQQDSSITYLPFPKQAIDPAYVSNPANTVGPYAIYATLKDKNGHLWIGTQSKGVCRYNGKSFTWFTEKGLGGPAVLDIFEDKTGTLWFGNNGSGLFRYDGKILRNITEEKGLSNPAFQKLGKPKPGTLARVWAINEDAFGNIWIGTGDSGVWSYDGNNLINYTEEDGLPNYPIETIYQDRAGQLWFGTNGGGVYRFNSGKFEKLAI